MSPLPKEDDLLRLWRLERELGAEIEIGREDRIAEIEFEIEELLNALPAHGPKKRRGRLG